MHYVLRVQGHLDPSWSDRLGGLRIEPQEAGTTLLSGSLPDQAAAGSFHLGQPDRRLHLAEPVRTG